MRIFCTTVALLTALVVLTGTTAAQFQGKGKGGFGAGPEVGQPAPDFKLKLLDGKEVQLASFKEKKPVVLIFGSCT